MTPEEYKKLRSELLSLLFLTRDLSLREVRRYLELTQLIKQHKPNKV